MATKSLEHSAAPFVPETRSLRRLAAAADDCRGCPLYEPATQAVFGAGPTRASLCLVGEQPGDVEDRRGRPFVGPAGRVLWQCVEAAGVPHEAIYATNAVKHFKHEVRGKRRIHQRPTAGEIDACSPWLTAELRVLRPAVIVALGAVAVRSLLGRPVPIGEARGTTPEAHGRPMVVTYHPSAVLRADDPRPIQQALVDDLARAWALVGQDGDT